MPNFIDAEYILLNIKYAASKKSPFTTIFLDFFWSIIVALCIKTKYKKLMVMYVLLYDSDSLCIPYVSSLHLAALHLVASYITSRPYHYI